ncbi:tyrosine--tRNA ligase [Thermodesulfobacteriota bacterium]
MNNMFDIFKERGFIKQCSNEKTLRKIFSKEKVTGYIGFDPTAESFHAGSLIPIMALAWMERMGHRPIVIMGGGTALLGDPSGKNEARKLMSPEQIKFNMKNLKKELRRYLHLSKDRTQILNNVSWLSKMKYIPFMREVGVHFKLNVMIKAESCNKRLKSNKGMPFNEFSYPLLQAFDFLHLYKNYNCILQMGGSDQWGNITDGLDLIKRKVRGQAYCITFPLLEIDGKKAGQSEKDTKIWLNPEKTSPYEFYQFWINTKDDEVDAFLRLFTFLQIDEIRELTKGSGAELNRAKRVLAYEVTRLAHGKRAAEVVRNLSKGLFSSKKLNLSGIIKYSNPITIEIPMNDFEKGIWPADLLKRSGLVHGTGAGRKIIMSGGAYINRKRIKDVNEKISTNMLDKNGLLLLQKGKKDFIIVKAINEPDKN